MVLLSDLPHPVWPIPLPPKPDELLSSWLVRLAHAHQVKVHSFCRHVWPQVAIWNRDIDKLAPPELLQTLAARTLTPIERVRQTTLMPYCERLIGSPVSPAQGHTAWLMPLGIYHRTHRIGGLVYCPLCLERDGATPYYRTVWRLAFHIVCPTCGIYLHERCPACGEPVNFFRIELGRKSADADRPISTCHRCAFNLGQSPVEPAPVKTLRRYRSLYRISREGWNQGVLYPHQYFRVLRQLLRLLGSSFWRAQPLQVDLRLRRGHALDWNAGLASFEQLPIAQRACLLDEALWLLDDWPHRFITLMRYHRLSSTTILKDMTEDVPFWFDSVITEHFYVTNVNRRFGPAPGLRAETGINQFIAPINGLAGGPRRYDAGLNCPRCNSNWISRNGFRAGKQRYECQQCHRHFTESNGDLVRSAPTSGMSGR